MASPLNWFRRNAIWIMVPVGIFCMAFFGLGAVFDTLTSTARIGTRENPTIASFDGGDFTRVQLDQTNLNHHRTRNFLNELRNLGVDELQQRGEEYVPLVTPIQPIMDGEQDVIDDQLVSRLLLAEKAEAEGLKISDSMIDEYLFGTYGVIDGTGISIRKLELLNREVNNGQISMAAIRRQLKTELLCQKMETLSLAGIPKVPNPMESIQHYAKMTQKMEGEIFPVSIKDYVDESANPSQTEIRALFDEGKYDLKDPAGEEPGFKLPRRVKMQYFVGSYQDFLDIATAELSDEEIQAKYDELVAQESDLVMEIIPDDSPEGEDMPPINLEGGDEGESDEAPKPTAGDEAESDEAPKPAAADDGDASEEDAADDTDQSYKVGSDSKFVLVSMPAQEEQPPAVEVPAVPAIEVPAVPAVEVPATGEVLPVGEGVEVGEAVPQTEVPATEVPVTEVPVTEVPVTEVPVTEVPVTEVPVTEVPVTEVPVTEVPQTEVPATEVPATEVPASGVPMTEIPAAVDPPADLPAVVPVDETETGEAATPEPPAGGADAATDAPEAGSLDSMKDDVVVPMLTDDDRIIKRAKPLGEVADAIRRQLKGPEATEAMKRAILTAESEVENYFTQHLQWEVNGKERKKPAPEVPNFKEIAERNGLRFAETELVNYDQLSKTELGGIFEIINSPRGPRTAIAASTIFQKFNQLSEYSTATIDNRFTGKSYVYWPVELAESEVPKLEDCKETIVEYWRERKAVVSAKKAAEAIAAKASADKKLSDIDPAKTIQTGEFTWFQPRQTPRGPRAVLSSPIGVESPSEEFMETAFSLNEGEAGVAVDGAGETIYVIQSQTKKQPISEIGDDFLKNQLFRFQRLPPDVGLVNGHYFQKKMQALDQQFDDSVGLEFKN